LPFIGAASRELLRAAPAAAQVWIDADFTRRREAVAAPPSELDPLEELRRTISAGPQRERFRIQFSALCPIAG
jgi:hypothetical protein